MSVRTGLVLLLAVSTLSLLVGCGSSSPTAVAPPSGGFSVSNLNGTYVFSVSGIDVNGVPLSILGALTAEEREGLSAGLRGLVRGLAAEGLLGDVPPAR